MILVTGGAGLLGKELITKLLQAGKQVSITKQHFRILEMKICSKCNAIF